MIKKFHIHRYQEHECVYNKTENIWKGITYTYAVCRCGSEMIRERNGIWHLLYLYKFTHDFEKEQFIEARKQYETKLNDIFHLLNK